MDNRRGPRDNYRDRSDRNEERHNSRQQGGDDGESRRQQGQYSQDYGQHGTMAKGEIGPNGRQVMRVPLRRARARRK